MNRVIFPVLGFAVLIFVLASSQRAAPAADPPTTAELGNPAPGFELKDVFGKPFKLSDFKGHVVVLEWINFQCPVSHGKHDDKTMQDVYKKFADKGVVWLAIDSTAGRKPEENRVYAAKQGLAYPILHDPDGKVGRTYGAATTPHMYVIDAKGTLVYNGAIDDKGSTNHVAEAVGATLAGKKPSTMKTAPYGCSVKYAR